jgi:nucleotide-binding universal stress UspA family protein
VAVDESASGRFAARLAGVIAGCRNMPATVLHVGPHAKEQEKRKGGAESPESYLAAGVQAANEAKQEKQQEETPPPHIITRTPEAGVEAAIAEEAKKGFDLMVVGIDADAVRKGGFPEELARMTAGFEGPLAIVIAHGEHVANPADSKLNILTAVTGTETSRRGAEIAAVLARARSGSVTAIYVSSDSPRRRRRGAVRPPPSKSHEQAILEDFGELAQRYGVAAQTVVRVNEPPDKAILAETRDGGFDTIVMGVNRRPGTALFFGDVAASVIENAAASIVLVTSAANPGAANNAEKNGKPE